MTVADLGEHAVLARILARLPLPGAHVLVGPGDDAAVIATGRNERLVVTTDTVIDEVHFSRRSSPPADIGHKALAVNLSDLAAMGAIPSWGLLSLALPGALPVADVEALVDGFAASAKAAGLSVVGGNVTRSPGPLMVDVTVAGGVASRKWLTRGGGCPGDELWVSGTLGGARAALEMWAAGEAGDEACAMRQRRPEARIRLGHVMARTRTARAAMDLSDGLADAVRQLAAASGCGARVDGALVPIEPGAEAWWRRRGDDPVEAAIRGGEDYELLFAVPARRAGRLRHVRRQVAHPALTRIGVLTRDPALWLERDGARTPWPEGFAHFGA